MPYFTSLYITNRRIKKGLDNSQTYKDFYRVTFCTDVGLTRPFTTTFIYKIIGYM